MDLLYITDVESREGSGEPNFTIPGSEYNSGVEDSVLKNSAGAIAAGTLAIFTPPALLVGASIAIPAIYKLLISNDDQKVPVESLHDFESFINKHSISKHEASKRGFKFPPGHPQIGETYRLHPLAKSNVAKENLYIPEYIFDDVLFEERESELLSLLVNLGATRVEISKYLENYSDINTSGSLSGEVGSIGGAQVGAGSGSQVERNGKDVRVFSLKGKPWHNGDKVELGGYSWFNFEPSWGALVMAREVGGCTSATIEIKEASKYTANKEASIQLKAKIYSAGGNMKLLGKSLNTTTYIVKVDFSEISGE